MPVFERIASFFARIKKRKANGKWEERELSYHRAIRDADCIPNRHDRTTKGRDLRIELAEGYKSRGDYANAIEAYEALIDFSQQHEIDEEFIPTYQQKIRDMQKAAKILKSAELIKKGDLREV